MRRALSILAGLAVATAFMLPHCAAEEGEAAFEGEGVKKEAAGREGAKKEVAARREREGGEGKREREAIGPRAAFANDLEKVATVCSLSDEQKQKLQEMKQARDKALQGFDQKMEPRISKIGQGLSKLEGRGKQDKQAQGMRNELNGYMNAIATGRDQLETTHDKRMFAALTAEQRAQWNTPILKEELMKDFSLLFLDSKQEEKIEALCQTQAKRLTVPVDPQKHEQLVEALKVQVYKTILNREQQVEYRKFVAATATKKGGEDNKGGRGGGKVHGGGHMKAAGGGGKRG